jgi:hypothetical protein
MSRSFKKTPWAGDSKGKIKKRIANKAVRNWLKQHPDVAIQGGQYKKIYETWDICDYGWITSWEEYWASCIKNWERWFCRYGKPYPDKKEEYREWLKRYKIK